MINGSRLFVRPRRFPLGTILELVAALFVLGSFGDRWALAPTGDIEPLQTWQGVTALVASSSALVLAIGRLISLPPIRRLWYFLPVAFLATAMLISSVSFIVVYDVVALNETAPPEALDPTTVRGDYVGMALAGAVVYTLVAIVHGTTASLMIDRGSGVALIKTTTDEGSGLLLPELRPSEEILAHRLVNVHGLLVAGPRLARMVVTSERIVFVPPLLSRGETWNKWIRHIGVRHEIGHQPPIGEVIAAEYLDIVSFGSLHAESAQHFAIAAGSFSTREEAWGFTVMDDPFGVAPSPLEEQVAFYEVVRAAWALGKFQARTA